MKRRDFLTNLAVASAAVAVAPSLAFGQPLGPRIITNTVQEDDPRYGCFRLFKNGQQIGLVYWANLDTKAYRRGAMESDFWEGGPWDGGRLVRRKDVPASEVLTYPSWRYLTGVSLPQRDYPIGHFPIVEYDSHYFVTVEGTFDECVLSYHTPASVRAEYPDLRVGQPPKKVPHPYFYEIEHT